jgi:hypothetical protein
MYLGTAEKIIEAMKGSEGKPYAKLKSLGTIPQKNKTGNEKRVSPRFVRKVSIRQ